MTTLAWSDWWLSPLRWGGRWEREQSDEHQRPGYWTETQPLGHPPGWAAGWVQMNSREPHSQSCRILRSSHSGYWEAESVWGLGYISNTRDRNWIPIALWSQGWLPGQEETLSRGSGKGSRISVALATEQEKYYKIPSCLSIYQVSNGGLIASQLN